jgi:hypothetical protein
MTHRKLNRIVAASVFCLTLLVYMLSLPPTVVFWDVGEFIAAAKMLQVPHPPGAPLFLLLTRVAMMVPFVADQAVRAHALAALLSAGAVMFLYLVVVKVLINYRGMPGGAADKVVVYGSAAVGAFTLALSTSFWGNAIEAEVYGASSFFLAAIMWLVMRWRERADIEGNEKYLIIIAYLIGLSLGVHLLALLAIFPVLLIVYFRKYEFSRSGLLKLVLVSVGVFVVVYPGIVKYVPDLMDGEFAGKKGELIAYLPWIIILAVCYGVYWSYRERKRVLHISLLSILLIFIGYTTYTSVLIRSNVDPPMNENDPSTISRITSYLSREQYGDAPLFMPRRYSREPHQQAMYKSYSSEWDFLFRYQLNHMFVRYLGWNFIGAAGDQQDSGVDWKETLGLPFLFGLFGMFSLFRRDWKMGLVFLAMFIILGPILALYQNQQEPQPRERDYFYVGAFYVFSLWIGVGVAAAADFVREKLKPSTLAGGGAIAVVAILFFAVPVRSLQVNWHQRDRSGNYVAWDYSYNILQTCTENAILFTNGDNDTFPLWYLQDVEGIRRDVRIVNLSLVNTPWYIQQMKDEPYYEEAEPVPISLSDARIADIQPVAWEPREMRLPVTPEAIENYGVTDSAVINDGSITFMMNNTVQFGQAKAIRIQDIIVQDIVYTNQWRRPIYFAVTVAPDSKIGLDDYLWFHGLAWRLEPRKIPPRDLGMAPEVVEANLFNDPETFSQTPQYGYLYRRIGDPDVYFDENASRLMLNYRSAFIRLAMYYGNIENESERAVEILDRMEELIPGSKVPMAWELESDVMSFYNRMGRRDRFDEYAARLEEQMQRLIENGQFNPGSYYNPYRVLLEIYEVKGDYAEMLDLLKSLSVIYPNDPNLQQRIAAVKAMLDAQRSPEPDTLERGG